MKILKFILPALLTFASASFTCNAQEAPKNFVIRLTRSSCWSGCQAYSLTISGDGGVTFVPEPSLILREWPPRIIPPSTGQISREQLNKLIAKFKEIKFLSIKSEVGIFSPHRWARECRSILSDLPTAEINFSAAGKSKTVIHYLGCEGYKVADKLTELENTIDEAANTQQWTSRLK